MRKIAHIGKDFHSLIFVMDKQVGDKIVEAPDSKIIGIEDSLGEVHSLSATLSLLNTEFVVVAYADIEDQVFNYFDLQGVLFQSDKFAGLFSIETDSLPSVISETDPRASMMEMLAKGNFRMVHLDG